MSVFFLLDILARGEYIGIDDIFDETTFCAEQSNGEGTRLFRQLQRINDVERVTAGRSVKWLLDGVLLP